MERPAETVALAAFLTELKTRSGLSYAKLATRLYLSQSTLHRYCNGDAVPAEYAPIERLARLCKATPDELVELHRRWILADAARLRDRESPVGAERPAGSPGPTDAQPGRQPAAGPEPAAGPQPGPPDGPEPDVVARPEPVAGSAPKAAGPASETTGPERESAGPEQEAAAGGEWSAAVGLEPGGGGDRSGSFGGARRRAVRGVVAAAVAVVLVVVGAVVVRRLVAGPEGGAAGPPVPLPAQAPLALAVDAFAWEDPCSGWYRIDRPRTAVPSPPPQQDAQVWVDRLGGVAVDHQRIELTLQGTGQETVVLQSLSVRVVRSGAPGTGAVYRLGDGCGGGVPTQSFALDLDAGRPEVKPAAGQRPFPFKVNEADPEVFYLTVRTTRQDVSWYLDLQWSSGDRQGVLRIDDRGRPFRTSPLATTPRYFFPLGGDRWLDEADQ